MNEQTIMTIKELKANIIDMLEYSMDDGIIFGGSLPNNMTSGMKPCVADKLFDTEEEAAEYEFKFEEYDAIRNLSDNDKIIQFYDENDNIAYKPL